MGQYKMNRVAKVADRVLRPGRSLTKIEALEENGHVEKRASAVEKFQKMVLDARKQTRYDSGKVVL